MSYDMSFAGRLSFRTSEDLQLARDTYCLQSEMLDSLIQAGDLKSSSNDLKVDWKGSAPASGYFDTIEALKILADVAASGQVQARFESEGEVEEQAVLAAQKYAMLPRYRTRIRKLGWHLPILEALQRILIPSADEAGYEFSDDGVPIDSTRPGMYKLEGTRDCALRLCTPAKRVSLLSMRFERDASVPTLRWDLQNSPGIREHNPLDLGVILKLRAAASIDDGVRSIRDALSGTLFRCPPDRLQDAFEDLWHTVNPPVVGQRGHAKLICACGSVYLTFMEEGWCAQCRHVCSDSACRRVVFAQAAPGKRLPFPFESLPL